MESRGNCWHGQFIFSWIHSTNGFGVPTLCQVLISALGTWLWTGQTSPFPRGTLMHWHDHCGYSSEVFNFLEDSFGPDPQCYLEPSIISNVVLGPFASKSLRALLKKIRILLYLDKTWKSAFFKTSASPLQQHLHTEV